MRDIQHHLTLIVGTELSHETISEITNRIRGEMLAWHNRPLKAFSPVVYLDAIVVKIRDGPLCRTRAPTSP